MENNQSSPSVRSSQLFRGIRFVLLGFDPIKKSQVSRKLVHGGGVDAGQYGPNCTHVIVDKLVYDDPLCVAARQYEKILVSSLWVDHSFDVGGPVDTTSVMYTPVRDLNGIPGAKSLVICLTGYQREDREDIMTMVELMGAQVSKPLIANRVTHLICYKFEGEKYLLAKKVKRIKLINHRWLEDCLKAWDIVPEADYSKSGYELEMEAEARDSEDEPEGITTRHNEGKISPHHSLLSKQEIPNTISNTSASNLFSNAQETVSVTMKTKSGQSPNPHDIKVKHQDTENIAGVTSEPSNHYGKTVSSSSAQNNLISASISANKSPQTEAKRFISASYSMKDPIRTTPSRTDMKSNTSSAKRLNKLNLSDAFNMSSSLVQKVTPYNSTAPCAEDEQNGVSSNKKKLDISGGSFKLQQINQNNDLESAFLEVTKDLPIETSLSPKPPSNIYGSKSLSSKRKNVICDIPISKTSTSEIEDLNAGQRPQKEYNETSFSTKSNNKDVSMAENVMQSPSAISPDLEKSSNLNSEINEQSAGSNPKPVRRKSISKKSSGPKLSKKNTVNQKGSIFLKNTDPEIDDENLFKYQQFEKVSPVTKSGREIKIGAISGMQIDSMSENKSLCMDDETEPPDDKDEASKEKNEDRKPENTVDILMEEKAEGNVDVVDPSTDMNNDENDVFSFKHKVMMHKSDGNTGDLASEIPPTKKGKKNTALSMKEVSDKKSVKKTELMTDNHFGKQEITEEATPNRAKRARRNANDLDKSVEVKRADACNDIEHNNNDDVDADTNIENVVNKETKRNKRSLSKAKKDVSKKNGTDLEKSVEVKKSVVCNDPKHSNDEKGDDVDADMDIMNIVNKNETNSNKRSLSKAKKDVSKKSGTDLEKSVEVKKSGVCNDREHSNDDDVDADMDIENVVNKNETKSKKHALSKAKKDDSKKNGTDLEKSMEVKKSGVCNDPEHSNDGVDAEMDIENVSNKNETKRNKRSLSKAKKDASKRHGTDLEKNMEVKKSGVCNDPEHNSNEKGEDVDANMDIENVVNKNGTKRNKSLASKTKNVSKRNATDLEKSVDVERAEGVGNDPEHNKDQKDDDVDADMDIENVVNEKETKRNKRPLSKTKKDASKRNATDFEKSVDVEISEGVGNDPEHSKDQKDDDVEADMDIENVVNEETKINKHPLSKTKKDASKRNATDLEKSVEVRSAEGVCNDSQHKNDGADKDANMDTENVLNKKESKTNKRPLSKTKKDAAKAVNKKGKPTSNQAVETCDLEEAQKENVQIHANDQSTGNKHVFKPAKEVPEKNIDKGVSAVLKDEPMWFILTGHTLQRKEFQQIIKRLKGRVCRVAHNWSYQATHFIVPDPIRRTEKFFAAAASGRWILKTDYLSASNQAGKFVAEEAYEWHKSGLSEDGQINLEAPRKWRLLKEKTGHGAFYGMKIVIYGECISPPLDTLKRAVKAGDGTILATSPPYTRFLNTGIDFAVVSPGMPHVDMWVQEFLKHEVPCVSADYLVEYVCKPGYPLEKHVQYGTNVWAERSYNDLQNRYLTKVSEPETPDSNDVACEVCGSHDRGEEMLICGDEGGLIGCGIGTHIDCCDPPLESVPEEDWFCCKCSKKPNNRKSNKGSTLRGK